MSEYYWDDQADYLIKSRGVLWNTDYLEFLIQHVWKVDKAVRVADFGCGMGYLGAVMMPMLPKGSTYTGLDKGEKLIERAKQAFSGASFTTDFRQLDLLEDSLTETYDLVICQAVLMHIPQPERLLKKMIEATNAGGLVICVETNWNVANAALYVDGMDVDSFANLGILQKLWNAEKDRSGIDRCVGMKVPVWMQKLGLHDVGIRMNDCVRFVNPSADAGEHTRQLDTFLSEGWGRKMEDEQAVVEGLCARGLTEEEARRQYKAEKAVNDYVAAHQDTLFSLSVPPMFIAYGRK